MNNKEVARKWATGENARGSNLRSVHGRLISYTTCVGVKVSDDLFLLTDIHYSASTAQQLSHARLACAYAGGVVIEVHNVTATNRAEHAANHDKFKAYIVDALELYSTRAGSARYGYASVSIARDKYGKLVDAANLYNKAFKLRRKEIINGIEVRYD